MKVAILGDFHLGYPRFYEDSFQQAELAFSKACEVADLIILVGDIFDTKVPKLEVIERALKIFKNSKGKPVLAIHGTHERRYKGSVNPIQVMESAGVWKDIHNRKEEVISGNEKIFVQGLGGVPEEYASAAIKAAGFKAEENAFNIFVFHQSLKEFIPSGREILGVEDLPPGFDLYACGHMHKNRVQTLRDGVLIIPGSTVITQMRKEETSPKGIVLFDTIKKTNEFLKIKTRQFFFREIEVDGTGAVELRKIITDEINSVISSCEGAPIIKVKVKGSLKTGFRLSDLTYDEFTGKAFVEIDSDLRENQSSKSSQLIRDMRGNKTSIKDMGLEMLKRKLSEAKCGIKDVEGLFDRLNEGKRDEVISQTVDDN